MTEEPEFTLYISGGWHITSPGSRIDNLAVDPDVIDVVFEEDVSQNPPSKWEIIANWAFTPLICLFFKLYLFGLSIASLTGITDSGIVDTLQSHGAQVVQTDRNYHRLLASERLLWGVGHWAFFLMILFGLSAWLDFLTPIFSILFGPVFRMFPSALQTPLIAAVFGFELVIWFLVAGSIMGLFFITGTTETRNVAIMNEIEHYVREHPEQTTGCLVVGGAHVPHLKELISESNLVELGD